MICRGASVRPCVLAFLLVLVPGIASGAIVDDLSLVQPLWPAAGGDPVTIRVTAFNQSQPVSGAPVTCTCAEGGWGSVAPQTVVTDATGIAEFTFTPGTLAGAAPIMASSGVCSENYSIDIDHAPPDHIAGRDYTGELEVGTTTTITLSLADRYGNPVDSRNAVESVRFIAGTSGLDAGLLVNGSVRETATVPVDGDGQVEVAYRADTAPGDQLIYVDPPDPIPAEYLVLHGIATGVPYSITRSVTPTGDPHPAVPADGESLFAITYTLRDRFGNPTGNQSLTITSSSESDDPATLRTNSDGQVRITYGPRETAEAVLLTAVPGANQTLEVSDTLVFYNTDPVSMVLSASPQTMASRDVDGDMTAEIRAKVMDEQGNPVAGETVDFDMVYSDPHPAATLSPELSATSAVTGEDGTAVVSFAPGAFMTAADPGWNESWATATDSCTVTADWEGRRKTMEMTWKNYPYLSVETSVAPVTLEVNETVLLTIRLTGDGWALEPDPVDVVLAVDRSGSMLKDYPDRMVSAMEALETFSAGMSADRDRAGLVSFGVSGEADILDYYSKWAGDDDSWYDDTEYIETHYPGNGRVYEDYATVDLSLTHDQTAYAHETARLVPLSGTPMRGGLYRGLTELSENGRDGAVKAVILLSDGDYNWYGDPLARGDGYTFDPVYFSDLTRNYHAFPGLSEDEQDLSVYAANHNISIHSIAYADDISNGGKAVLQELASRTGGTYYHAPTGADLADIYTAIAGELREEAAVNATMDLPFSTVEVNNRTISGGDVLEYIYSPPDSTKIRSWNETTVIRDETIDQTADWEDDTTLSFDVGTVSLGQVWETTVALRMIHAGNINLFGGDSLISFNEGEDTLPLPDTFITVLVNQTDTGVDFTTLDIHDLRCLSPGPFTEILPVGWEINYTGSEKIREDIAWSSDGGLSWTTFDLRHTTGDEDSTALDLRDLPAGEYLIRVRATTPDSPGDTERLAAPVQVGQASQAYILLE
ncbi:MAG: hypothetical protein ACP5C4_00025 [Methanomicrobiales archaeon]